jgi:hypothetical protein
MPQAISNRRRSAAAAVLIAVLASLVLAACGSSSNSSSSSSTTSTVNTSASTLAAGQAAARSVLGRLTAIRACLKKNGVTLPERKPGQRPPGGLLGGGGPPAIPKGMSRAQYDAVLKKCGAGFARSFNGGARIKSPAVKQALAKFAACMRSSGVSVPTPDTSGNGPIFNTKGLNTSSPQFRAAEAKCRSDLQGAFRASPGGAPHGSPSTTG